MYAACNTTISVLRGTTTNAFGDVVDGTTPVHTGIAASLLQNTKREQGFPSTVRVADASSDVPRQVFYYILRVQSDTDIVLTDRILDEADQSIYAISRISSSKTSVNVPDLRIDLTRLN